MWYRVVISNLEYDENNIIHPGTTEIPQEYKRGYHSVIQFNQNMNDILKSILNEGLRIDKGRGNSYGEPNLIWGTLNNYDKRYNPYAPTVELKISPELQQHAYSPVSDEGWNQDGNHFALTKSVNPEDIISIHLPWHDDLRYVLNNLDLLPNIKKDIEVFSKSERYAPLIKYLIVNNYL